MIYILEKKKSPLPQCGVETGKGKTSQPLLRRHLAAGLGSRDSDLGHCIMLALEPQELELLILGQKGTQEHQDRA